MQSCIIYKQNPPELHTNISYIGFYWMFVQYSFKISHVLGLPSNSEKSSRSRRGIFLLHILFGKSLKIGIGIAILLKNTVHVKFFSFSAWTLRRPNRSSMKKRLFCLYSNLHSNFKASLNKRDLFSFPKNNWRVNLGKQHNQSLLQWNCVMNKKQ